MLLQGAATIFGIKTELLLNLTKERIESEIMLQIFAVKCKVSIYAGYPKEHSKLTDASFGVKVELTTGMEQVGQSEVKSAIGHLILDSSPCV